MLDIIIRINPTYTQHFGEDKAFDNIAANKWYNNVVWLPQCNSFHISSLWYMTYQTGVFASCDGKSKFKGLTGDIWLENVQIAYMQRHIHQFAQQILQNVHTVYVVYGTASFVLQFNELRLLRQSETFERDDRVQTNA